jgi:CelD/BcsL family acetyltransferase involved in cellulose biosynthesis
MKLEVYEGGEGFFALQREWGELLRQSATDTLFLTWEWQRAWWDAFGSNRSLRLLTIRGAGGNLSAIVPLFVQDTLLDPDASLPEINIENPSVLPRAEARRTVHWVGGSEVSDYLDLVALAESNRGACAAFLDYLAEREDWQILDLRSVPSVSPTISAVAELARARGWEVQQVREDVCPVLELPDTWDGYLAERLDKKKRHELRRKMRKAERETDVRWYWVEPYNLDVGLQVFFELHRASDPDKGSFMTKRMEGFFRGVSEAARDSEWLRLAIMRFDGHAVASHLCFDYGEDRLVYNSGFDVDTYGELSPGIVLMGYLIEDAIKSRLRRFDFLQGGERYKYDLGATDTEVMRVFIRR